jgi:hypothetical protein
VLSAHTRADRPLGFDQVVQLCGGRVTRAQVRTASAVLCRDGDLDRIRSGVYQWAGGARAAAQTVVAAPARDLRIVPQRHTPATGHPVGRSAAELFEQLFPGGVRMTAELLSDFEQWAQLTEKLAAYANAS